MGAESTPGQGAVAGGKRKWARIVAMVIGGVVLVVGGLVGVAFGVTSSKMSETYDVEPVALAVKPSPALIEKGKAVATFRGCRDCHGEDLSGRVVGDAMPVMVLAGSNITPGGVTRDYTDEDWARAIRHGLRKDKTPIPFMPSFEWTELSHEDLAAIISYARSVPTVEGSGPRFEVGPLGRILYLAGQLPLIPAEIINHDAKPQAPTPGPTAEYGRYLITGCTGCHGEGLSGGPIPGVPPDWPVAANLTQHETGMKDWTFEDFKKTLRTGVTKDGRNIPPEYMPWKFIGQSSDDDLQALWEYTRTVEPKPIGNR